MRTPCIALALALALTSTAARAQKVVILELDGDTNGRLRAQVEAAVKKANVLEVVPLASYKENAAKRKLKGGAAMTSAGFARISRFQSIDAAVSGEVSAGKYNVVIYDFLGQELWTKSLTAKGGVLTDEFAGKLARAIVAAAEQGAKRRAQGDAPVAEAPPDEGRRGGEGDPEAVVPERRVAEPVAPYVPPPPEERDSDLDLESKRRRSSGTVKGVPMIRASLTGLTVWRTQCLRPGVATCVEYDQRSRKPDGVIIDFSASAPYPGAAAAVEFFPLAKFDNRIAQGFGVLARFGQALSQTRIVEETPQGNGPEKLVISTDVGFMAQAAWRFHFNAGASAPGEAPPVGYVGVRGGIESRSFNIDPTAGTALPSSVRTAPTGVGFAVVGLDASVPVSKYFRIEGALSLYVNPTPGPEQIVGYGNLSDPTGGVQSTGLGFEGGFAGDIYGAFGWTARARVMQFADRYFGQGQKWVVCNEAQCGGASEERYISLFWGVTAAY